MIYTDMLPISKETLPSTLHLVKDRIESKVMELRRHAYYIPKETLTWTLHFPLKIESKMIIYNMLYIIKDRVKGDGDT